MRQWRRALRPFFLRAHPDLLQAAGPAVLQCNVRAVQLVSEHFELLRGSTTVTFYVARQGGDVGRRSVRLPPDAGRAVRALLEAVGEVQPAEAPAVREEVAVEAVGLAEWMRGSALATAQGRADARRAVQDDVRRADANAGVAEAMLRGPLALASLELEEGWGTGRADAALLEAVGRVVAGGGAAGLRLRVGQGRSRVDALGRVHLGRGDVPKQWAELVAAAAARRGELEALPELLAATAVAMGGVTLVPEHIADLPRWIRCLEGFDGAPRRPGRIFGGHVRRRATAPQSPSPHASAAVARPGEHQGIEVRLSQRIDPHAAIRIRPIDGSVVAPAAASARRALLQFLSRNGGECRAAAAAAESDARCRSAALAEASERLGTARLAASPEVRSDAAIAAAGALQALPGSVAQALVGLDVLLVGAPRGCFSLAGGTLRIPAAGPLA